METNIIEIIILSFLVLATLLLLFVAIADDIWLRKRKYKTEVKKFYSTEKISPQILEEIGILKRENSKLSLELEALMIKIEGFEAKEQESVSESKEIIYESQESVSESQESVSKSKENINTFSTPYETETYDSELVVENKFSEETREEIEQETMRYKKEVESFAQTLTEEEYEVPIIDIKGIGPKTKLYLNDKSIYTVRDFIEKTGVSENLTDIISKLPGLKHEKTTEKIKKIENMLIQARKFLDQAKTIQVTQ